MKYTIFIEIKGFFYQGLKISISSISVFFCFYLIPNEIFGNKYIIKFIEFISIHTPGIYFIHLHVSNYLTIFSLIKKQGTLSEAIFIYLMSYFISLFGKLIFKKTQLINLFQ